MLSHLITEFAESTLLYRSYIASFCDQARVIDQVWSKAADNLMALDKYCYNIKCSVCHAMFIKIYQNGYSSKCYICGSVY